MCPQSKKLPASHDKKRAKGLKVGLSLHKRNVQVYLSTGCQLM